MESELVNTTNPGSLAAAQPLDQNPAAVYLASLPSPTGRRTQKQALDAMAVMLGAGDCFTCPWHALRYQHTAAMRARLMESFKPATVNKYLSALRGVLRQAWRLELMTAEDYQRATDLESVTGETIPSGRAAKQNEIYVILKACQDDPTPAGVRDAAIISLLYACGLRRDEITRLDLAGCELDPQAGEGWLVFTGKRNKERRVPVVNGAFDALADWLDSRGQESGALFWPVNKGGRLVNRRMTNQAVYNLLQKRMEEAKVTNLTPHDLRRTFISELLDAGADVTTVAKMAGHANVQTTARYDRRPEEAKRKAARLLTVPYTRRNK